jgi:lon-related putative ATP-dependent protease
MPHPLPAAKLHTVHDPERIPWPDTTAIPLPREGNGHLHAFQPRAMKALDLAFDIPTPGYNVYLAGDPGLGRTYTLLSYLAPRARRRNSPPDLVYVHNFADPDTPTLLILETGQGARLRQLLRDAMDNVATELDRRMQRAPYVKESTRILKHFQDERRTLVDRMTTVAGSEGFQLDMDDAGSPTLYPLVEGKRLSQEEFDQLDFALRMKLKRRSTRLLQSMAQFMRRLNKAEESLRGDQSELVRQVMIQVLDTQLTPVRDRMLKNSKAAGLAEYFEALREDILKHVEDFLPVDPAPPQGQELPKSQDFCRYEANLLVDNSRQTGAPIVVEDNPTAVNLLGCIERKSEMGALVTDFTLIKAGSLHRANGGYLVLHVDDFQQHQAAWDGLLRALRANSLRIEDAEDPNDAGVRTKGISPAPLPLDVKVILVGDEDVHEQLLMADVRFGKLFLVKAHMNDIAVRNARNIRAYLQRIAQIVSENGLPAFDRTALAWLIDYGSVLCEDQLSLSLKFPLLREIMIEGASMAKGKKGGIVDASALEVAHAARINRVDLVEERFMEDYDRKLIKVQTSGSAVGQVNGLSVTWHGDFEFGLPHRISCTVGVGHEGIIDLEREAELGGPIHTKAMMIIKSYLTGLFARRKPLELSASLYFEQNYAEIEGDSASGAELAALVSALADVPVRLDMAFTGAVSHSGQVMAVGAVTRKIEGFYKVCARRGLTGTQGVIIPQDNVSHLMLDSAVCKAVEEKRFAIYPVSRIEQALELLTGRPAGQRSSDDTFTAGSLYDLADKRLQDLGTRAHNAYERRSKDRRPPRRRS